MILLKQFGIRSRLKFLNYDKILLAVEKFTGACLFQIALEIT